MCGITSTIPDNMLDEVAFAGKSNVGKSSLINALMNRKALARTSSQPGKTQTINFYNVNESMYLVDLPGYGYANANVEIKAKWGQMIENYLHTSKRLKAVFLLIDIRHEPSENDQLMYEWMGHQGYAPIIIATKADKLKRGQVIRHVQMIREVLQMEPESIVIPFSAETKQGREEIWELIDSLVEIPEEILEEQKKKEQKKQKEQVQKNDTPARKPRWKATDRPVAKNLFVCLMLAGILLVSVLIGTVAARRQETPASKELTVVTSFYPMYIAAENVIGDATDVRLENLSEPQTGCLHDFQLTPEDMKLLSTADVFIINGGGIESFMKDVAAAYPDLTIIEACENVQLLAEGNDENAHAWMSIAAYETQVQTIADELGKADAAHKDLYEANAKAYKEKLEPLKERQKKIAEAANGQNVILFHEAYDYVAEDYGLNVSYVLDLDEERQVSAGEIADVLAAVKKDHVKYILAEELYGKSTGDTIEAESDVKVLYLDPLNKGNYDADSYLEGMSKNMDILEQYLDR